MMTEFLKKRLFQNKILKIITAVFCILIVVATAYTMFFLYEPSHNALGALATVSMDTICMLILFILIGSIFFGNFTINRTTKLYVVLLLATIWAMFLDLLNWVYDGELSFDNFTCLFTVGSLCMGAVLVLIFSLYIYSYMNEMHGFTQMRKSAFVCAVLNLVSFFISFTLAVTKTAFTFVDGHYQTGVLYDAVTAIPVLTILYLTCYMLLHVKKIGTHDTVAVTGYILFMVFGALLESTYRIGSTYVAVAIADIFIFVMLQNEIIAAEKRRVEEWIKRSNTDDLTGFFNRNAYEDDIQNIENAGIADDLIYVSIDVNALKSVNDSLGHMAGDELIIGAAKCLGICLGSYGKIYRTGGDEFAAIIHIDAESVETIKHELDEETDKWKGKLVDSLAISYGFVTRVEAKQMSIRQIAVLADKRMYDAKARYYQTTGIERRNS